MSDRQLIGWSLPMGSTHHHVMNSRASVFTPIWTRPLRWTLANQLVKWSWVQGIVGHRPEWPIYWQLWVCVQKTWNHGRCKRACETSAKWHVSCEVSASFRVSATWQHGNLTYLRNLCLKIWKPGNHKKLPKTRRLFKTKFALNSHLSKTII